MLLILWLVGVYGVCPAQSPIVEKTQSPIVEKMKITDLEAYIQHADHPLIISFWATYCAPCIKEIPYLQSTVLDYKNRGVELILVSLDRQDHYPMGIGDFAKKSGYTSRIIWLDETDAGYFCPKIDPHWKGGIPSSLFINNETRYRQFFDRQVTDRQVEQQIKMMLFTPPPVAG